MPLNKENQWCKNSSKGQEKNKNLPKVTLQTQIKTKELSKSIIGKNSQASVTQIEIQKLGKTLGHPTNAHRKKSNTS